jgi:hypothetical protein
MRRLLVVLFLAAVALIPVGCNSYAMAGAMQGLGDVLSTYNASTPTTNYGSQQHKCPSYDMDMYFTGTTITEWGKLMALHRCAAGHEYWYPFSASGTSGSSGYQAPTTYVKDPCPVCGMGTYFSGETKIEWGQMLQIMKCPVGHESVKRM